MKIRALRFLIAIYRVCLSPWIHLLMGPLFGCRFIPTCSVYADEAFHIHGPFKGALYIVRRISRCHPFTQAGYDPVPHVIETHH